MAKKFGKFLMTAATLTAVAAGAYYYFKGKDAFLDDDFEDDFEDELDSEESKQDENRSYVDLSLENADEGTVEDDTDDDDETVTDGFFEENDETEAEEPDFKAGIKAAVADATDKVIGETKEAAEKVETKVEEFFNDEQE